MDVLAAEICYIDSLNHLLTGMILQVPFGGKLPKKYIPYTTLIYWIYISDLVGVECFLLFQKKQLPVAGLHPGSLVASITDRWMEKLESKPELQMLGRKKKENVPNCILTVPNPLRIPMGRKVYLPYMNG